MLGLLSTILDPPGDAVPKLLGESIGLSIIPYKSSVGRKDVGRWSGVRGSSIEGPDSELLLVRSKIDI